MNNKIGFSVELDPEAKIVFIQNESGTAFCEYEYDPNKPRESVMNAVSDWLHYYFNN